MTRITMASLLASALLLAAASPLRAQESAHFRIDQAVLNAAGHPARGDTMASGSWRLSLDALGDALAGAPLSSSSFTLGAGIVPSHPAPGEVGLLRFVDQQTLVWT